MTANADSARVYAAAVDGTIWDPRADLDDDSDVDSSYFWDGFQTKYPNWYPTVAQAFSDVDNPFLFQGRPHLALDTAADATVGVLMKNDHRWRHTDCPAGRWDTRDPLEYQPSSLEVQPPAIGRLASHFKMQYLASLTARERYQGALFALLDLNPHRDADATGLCSQANCCPDCWFTEECVNACAIWETSRQLIDPLSKPLGDRTYGYVVCCCQTIPCVRQFPPPYNGDINVRNCIIAHEDVHVDESRSCNNSCQIHRPNFYHGPGDEAFNECRAYKAGIQCILPRLYACWQGRSSRTPGTQGDDPCKDMEHYLWDSVAQMCKMCNKAGLPILPGFTCTGPSTFPLPPYPLGER